jgi:hypothetical protein
MENQTSITDAPAVAETARPSTAPVVLDRVRGAVARHRAAVLVVIAVGLVAIGQLVEDMADSPPMQMLPPTFLIRRWTVVVAVLYMLVISRLVERTVARSLPALQSVLGMTDTAFRRYAVRMQPPAMSVDLALLVISVLVVVLLFPVLGSDLPTRDPVTNAPVYLPTSVVEAVAVLAGYVIVGWAVLTLVYETVRLGRALAAASHETFVIDPFDTTNLLPFGNIALAVSLAPAGVIFILLLGLGQPNSILSWTVLLGAASASILALLLPLRAIHRQMADAKEAALATLNDRISRAYDEATGPSIDDAALGRLSQRTGTLIPLRKTVQEMTTWPFRDTVAFGRAVLIASAPLIYTALEELIKVIWINPLSH